MIKYITKRIVIIISILFLLLLFFNCPKKVNYNSTEDSIKSWRDSNNILHTKNNVLLFQNAKILLNLQTKDKEVEELQKIVKQYKNKLGGKSSVTNFKTVVCYDTIYKTKFKEVEKECSNINLTDSISNNWVHNVFAFNLRDSTVSLKLKIKNEYSVIIGEESQGWFKPKKPFVEVLNKNPYSETTKLRTFQVETKPIKKIGIGPGVYYGVGNTFQPQVFIGIGVQYNFIRL